MNSLHSIPRENFIYFSDDEKRAILAWQVEQNSRLRYSQSRRRLEWYGAFSNEWGPINIVSWSREYFYIQDNPNSPQPLPLEQFHMSMVDVVA